MVHIEESSLIFRRLEVVRSLPPPSPDDLEPSENQARKRGVGVNTRKHVIREYGFAVFSVTFYGRSW